MLRTKGLLLALCLTSGLMAQAQTVSQLEITSEPDALPLDVTTQVGVVADGIAQVGDLASGLEGAILLDLQGAPALAVSSEAATAPFDLILISPNGNIAAIVRRAAPGSQNPIAFSGPVAAILQLPAGSADEAGLKPGGSIAHNILGNQSPTEE